MTLSTQVITIITAIGGLVVPPVVSLLKQENWSAQIKQLVAGALSVGVAAAAIAIIQPSDFGLPLVTIGGLIYAGTQIIYGAYFKNSSFEVLLAAVGKKVPAVAAVPLNPATITPTAPH